MNSQLPLLLLQRRGILFLLLATLHPPLAAEPSAVEPPAAEPLIQAPSPQQSGLTAALHAVITHHPALLGKQAEINAKHYTLESVQSQRYPKLSAEASYDSKAEAAATLIRLQQPLWAFGKIDHAIAYAEADVVVEQSDERQIQRKLLEQTALAYVKIEGLRQRLQVAADNRHQLGELIAQIQRRHEGQFASDADVQLAHSRLQQAQVQQQRLEGELSVALNELQALTQIEINSQPAIDRTLFTPLDSDLATLQPQIADQSATLRYKQAQLNRAQQDRAQSEVSAMPTLSLRLDHTLREATPDDTRALLIIEGSLEGLGLTPLSRSRAAREQESAAYHDLNSSRNDIERQVVTLHRNRQLQQQLSTTQQATLTTLQTILDSYNRQYQAGRKSWLEVLNMHKELIEQRLLQVEADNSALSYGVRLLALLGQLDALSTQ